MDTIHTVDPNLWYISSPSCVPATRDIVQRWGTDPSCLILSILVVTSDFVRPGADGTCNFYRTEETRRQRCEQQHPKKPDTSNEQGGQDTGKPSKAQLLLSNLPNINYAFCFMDREMTQDLFGDAFTKLIDMAKKKPVKRAAPGHENSPATMEGPPTKKVRLTRCSACGAEGHMKTNRKCPEYQGT